MLKLTMMIALLMCCSCTSVEFLPQITMENNGQCFGFPAGQKFQIVLPSNPTTGYEWSVKDLNKSLVVVEKNYKGDNVGPDLMGAGGNEVWTFEVIESTRSFVVMEYSRPWESKNPVRGFKITINGK